MTTSILPKTQACAKCGAPVRVAGQNDKVPRMIFGSVVALAGLLTLFMHSGEPAVFDEAGNIIRLATEEHYPWWLSAGLIFFGAGIGFGTAVINLIRECSNAVKLWRHRGNSGGGHSGQHRTPRPPGTTSGS